jgi:uncharacterized membrane protein YgdD (TMEM256/DUF423 family)
LQLRSLKVKKDMASMTKCITRSVFVFACLTGGLSVLLAAYSAHVIGLEESSVRSVNSAIQMMQFHTLALLLVAWIAKDAKASWFLISSGLFFVIGIVFFSFNIALHQLMGINIFRSLIPYGGMAFVLGWVALAISAFLPKK